jgi:hypothetical protein
VLVDGAGGTGANTVGKFHAAIDASSGFLWSNRSDVNILNHVQAQLITWENAAPRSIVTITGASISIEPIGMAAFVCVVPSEANRFEIPTWVLLALPPSADMPDLPVSTGFLSVSFGTLQKLPTRAFLK